MCWTVCKSRLCGFAAQKIIHKATTYKLPLYAALANAMKLNSTDNEILSFVASWVNYLVQEDYESAFSLVKHDPYYQLSPKLLEETINGYGLPEPHPSGEVYKVTSPETAIGMIGQKLVTREMVSESCAGYVYYDLPLNGKWSDLTASFRLEIQKEELSLVLEEIHVF